MRRVIVPVMVFAALSFSQTTGSVEGIVENSVTRVGIAGVTVTVYTRQGSLYEATTKPGSYEVRFEKEGFVQGRKEPSQPYLVGQGQNPVRMRLGMIQHVSLSGRVVDGDGTPVSQAEVRLTNRNGVPVAADGTFTIKDLEPGSYTLAAVPKATPAPEGARVPVTTYAPGPIVIRGDADVSGYEIRLQTAAVYRISGVLLDETGNPKAGVTIRLLPSVPSGPRIVSSGDFITMVGPGPYTGPEEARVVSSEDGSFEFPAVRSGEWQAAAVSTGSIDSPDYAATVRSGVLAVVVSTRNVANLQIRMGTPFKLTGTVDWGDSPSRRAVIIPSSVDGRSGASAPSFFNVTNSGPGATSGSNGTLTLERVSPGKYILVPQPGPGYYPVSLLLGGQEVLGKPVDLFSGAPAFRLTYKAAAGSVLGTVENGDGALAVLIPRDVQTIGFGRMVTCKADGTFDMSGVPPGDYFVAAFEQFQRTYPIADAAWLARVESIGTRVSVAQGSVSVQLKQVRWPE